MGWLLGAIASVVLAVVTAFVGGFGSRVADRVASSSPPLLSYSASPVSGECTGGTFLPTASMEGVLDEPPPSHWTAIEAEEGAAAPGRDQVEVSIQGESARTVTLTGISFDVKRKPPSQGAIFNAPCGGPLVGRALEVDLDSSPAKVVDSTVEPNGILGSRTADGRPLTKPIRFPWTVSLTDPLLLYVVATTKSCSCTWSAEIPWVSGGKRGTIAIDNGGKGFRVVDGGGLPAYTALDGHWQRYPAASAP